MEMSYDDRPGDIWMNGEMVPWKNAQVHILSHAMHYASAVFEGIRAYDGRIFKLTEHNERLAAGAASMDMKMPYSVAEMDAACQQVLKSQGFSDAYLRPIIWRGSEMMGVSAQTTRINAAVAVWEWPAYFADRMSGIRMKWAKWRRPDPATIPCQTKAAGLYMICTLSKHNAEGEGYADALMLDYRGYIAEATGANIFMLLEDGKLHTPEPDCFLDGITKRTVMALARARGYEIVQRHIKPKELAGASEVFLTGTAVEVTPVREIGEYIFTPGDVTKTLMDDYDAEVRREIPATLNAA